MRTDASRLKWRSRGDCYRCGKPRGKFKVCDQCREVEARRKKLAYRVMVLSRPRIPA